MAMKLSHLPPPVADRLREFHRRKQLLRAIRATALTLLAYALMILIATHLDRFFFLDVATREKLLWGIHLSFGALALAAATWVLRHGENAGSLARKIESGLGDSSQERLVTLENLLAQSARPTDSPTAQDLLRQLETSTLALTNSFRGGPLAHDKHLKKSVASLGAAAIVLLLLTFWSAYQFPLMLARFYQPGANLPRPSFFKIDVTPTEATLGLGAEAVIQARIVDQTPAPIAALSRLIGSAPIVCELTLRSWREGEPLSDLTPGETSRMVRVQRDLFLFTRANMQSSATFQVRAGNAQTAVAPMRVVAQPKILGLTLTAKPPPYAALPSETTTDFSQPLRYLPKTELELSFKSDQELETIQMKAPSGPPIIPAWDPGTRTGRHAFTLKEPLTLEVVAVNKQGFANVERQLVRIGVSEDAPPTLRLDQPPQEIEAITGTLVEFRGQAEDDLGLAETALRYTVNPDPRREVTPREAPIALPQKGSRQFDFAASLDLEKTGAGPGDTVAVEVRARDTHGADGLSRTVTIRVMPMTRGGDEARRLAALAATNRLLQQARDAKSDANAERVAYLPFDADAYSTVHKAAADAGLDLDAAPNAKSLLDLLETEHYLTQDAQNKTDLRHLRCLLASAMGPLALTPTGGRDAQFRSRLAQISALLEPMIRYRRARNLLWRLAGMREECRRLRDVLSERSNASATESKADADEAMQRIDRRSGLFLAALQDQGTELLELVRSTGQLKPETAASLIGDLNETGYLLSKGAVSRRRSAATRLLQQINDAMAMARDLLPPLLKSDADARRILEKMNADVWNALALGDASNETWRRAAIDCLSFDRLACEREPLSSFWPRVADFALSERLSGRASFEPSMITAAWTSAAVVEERQVARGLAHSARIASIRQAPGVSDFDKSMECALASVEFMVNGSPESPLANEAIAALARLPVQPDGDPAAIKNVDILKKGLRPPAARATCAAVAQLADRFLGAAVNAALLKSISERHVKTAATLGALEESLNQSSAGDMPERLAAALASVQTDQELLQSTLERMTIALLARPGERAGDATVAELKEAAGRFAQRARPTLVAFAAVAAAPQEAKTIGEFKAQLPKLRALQDSLTKTITKLAANDIPSTDAAPWLARSELIARLALGDVSKQDQIRSAIASLDGVGTVLAQAQSGEVAESRVHAADGLRALGQPTPDAQAARAAFGRAAASLNEFERVISQLGSPAAFNWLSAPMATAKRDVAALGSVPDGGDPTAIARVSQAARDAIKSLTALDSAAKGGPVPAVATTPPFTGGPERAWAIRSGYEAEAVAAGLAKLSSFAEAECIHHLLAAGSASGLAGDSYDRAYEWAAARYRLVRSDLAGTGVARSQQKQRTRPVDPTIEYLRGELGRAKQQQKLLKDYGDASRAYLELIGDSLLY